MTKKKVVRKALRKFQDRRIAKIAQQVVSRNIEDKEARYVAQGFLFDSVINGSNFENGNIWLSNPTIATKSQGTGQGQRIGNRLKIKKFMYRQRFWCIPQTADANNYHLKMFVLTDKDNPNNGTTGSTNTAILNGPFFNNGSTSTGTTGIMHDMMLPIDTDRWRVHKTREFKLGFSTNPQGTTTGWGNNDYKVSCSVRVNLKKYLPKYVQYRDSDGKIYSRGVVIIFLIVKMDNTVIAPENNSGGIVGWTRVVDFVYEDA